VIDVSGLNDGGDATLISGQVSGASLRPRGYFQPCKTAADAAGVMDGDGATTEVPEVPEPSVPLSFLQQIWNN